MQRFVLLIILMILFFVQITIVDTNFVSKLVKRRFQNQDELVEIICGKNGIYCKRNFQ
jgi:hypothetical protein